MIIHRTRLLTTAAMLWTMPLLAGPLIPHFQALYPAPLALPHYPSIFIHIVHDPLRFPSYSLFCFVLCSPAMRRDRIYDPSRPFPPIHVHVSVCLLSVPHDELCILYVNVLLSGLASCLCRPLTHPPVFPPAPATAPPRLRLRRHQLAIGPEGRATICDRAGPRLRGAAEFGLPALAQARARARARKSRRGDRARLRGDHLGHPRAPCAYA